MKIAHISASCFTSIGVDTPIFTTYRVILLRAHATVVHTFFLGCYGHLRGKFYWNISSCICDSLQGDHGGQRLRFVNFFWLIQLIGQISWTRLCNCKTVVNKMQSPTNVVTVHEDRSHQHILLYRRWSRYVQLDHTRDHTPLCTRKPQQKGRGRGGSHLRR